MPIPLSCPCGRALKIKDEYAGRKVRCPACQSVLAVPAARPEPEPAEVILEVLPADESVANRRVARSTRQSAIQTEPAEPRSARRGSASEEGISTVRRRRDEDEEDRPVKARVRPRRDDIRRVSRRSSQKGGFGSINAGVAGGVLMILIAVVWFVAGLAGGIIFFYPPILLVIGIIAIGKGLMSGD